MNLQSKCDIIIVGGGIAGLWALECLNKSGFSTILLEKNQLGSGQTLKSQGIIHAGLKYSLQGKFTKSAQTVATMTQLWKDCLSGNGEVDLSSVDILSKHYYLWSNKNLFNRFKTLMSSKLLSSTNRMLKEKDYPTIFSDPSFNGSVFEVDELVLDTSSLINALFKNNQKHIFHTKSLNTQQLHIENEQIKYLTIKTKDETNIDISCQLVIFCAGEGNEQYSKLFTQNNLMQRRPLHMVAVKIPHAMPLYGHYIGTSTIPILTVTSHYTGQKELIWYLGGQIAEEGVTLSKSEQISKAQSELKSLLPWINYTDSVWETFIINRAEGQTKNHSKPTDITINKHGNALFAWPTKLVLAPKLANKLCEQVKTTIKPQSTDIENLQLLNKPEIIKNLWDTIFS